MNEKTWERTPLKPFTKIDWYGWAGAEHFPNKDEPLIATSDIAVLICDANGMALYWGPCEKDDDTDQYWAHFHISLKSAEQARLIAQGVYDAFVNAPNDDSIRRLAEAAGFTVENG